MEMRVSLTSVLVWIGLVGISAFAWRVVNWIWIRPRKLEKFLRDQGFSGKPYRILFGDTNEHSMLMEQAKTQRINFTDDISQRVIPFTHQVVTYYGKPFFMWIGPRPRVYILDPDLLKVIFTKMDEFQKQDESPIVKLLVTGILAYNGDKWTKHRKLISPSFQLEKLKLMLPAFYHSCNDMISIWEKIVPDEGSCELDVYPHMQDFTRDAISRAAFGSSFEEGKRIFELLAEQINLASIAMQGIYVPGWRFVPTKLNTRMKEIHKELGASLKAIIINKRERAIKTGTASNDDLLGVLIQSNVTEVKEHGDNKNVGMTMEEVIEECKVFYIAGQETTSVLLVWTLVLLAKHTEWQDRARAEVLQVFGKNKPEFDGLNHLKVVTMILNEVLRLYPPVVQQFREVHKETRLGDLTLPAGVSIGVPTLLVQRDKELWGEDANEFKPERFAEGASKATKNQFTYIPFGQGPRICVGLNFAMLEAKMALSMILQRFAFELSPSYTHAPLGVVLTVQPQHGAHIFIRKI